MHDHSNCNHDHSSNKNHSDEIDNENFQPVKLQNSNNTAESKNDFASFVMKWIYMVLLYLLFVLSIYFSFNVKIKLKQ